MGAFGFRPFENDSALDWLESFKQKKSIKKLVKFIEERLLKDDEQFEEFIAAAELISALSGHPSFDIDPDIEEWADKQRKKGADLSSLPIRTVERLENISTKSSLSSLWSESSDFALWKESIEELISRLKLPRRPKTESLPISAPKAQILYRERDALTIKILSKGVLAPSTGLEGAWAVSCNLIQELSSNEKRALLDFISTNSQLLFIACDYPSKRGVKLHPESLSFLESVKNLRIASETLPSIEKLAGSKSIRSLELWTLNSVQNLLSDVLQIKSLEFLYLYLVPKKALGMGLENCCQIVNLKHFEIQPIIKGFSEKKFKGEDTHYPLYWLSECKELKKLVLRNLISETETLDLRNCPNFDCLEIVNVEELKTVILPDSVGTISVQCSSRISIRFASTPKKLKNIIIGENISFEQIETLKALPLLKACSVTKPSQEQLDFISTQTNLVSLHLYDQESFSFNLSNLIQLCFLKISTSNIEKAVSEIMSIPNLQELEIWFNAITEISVHSFDPLKNHPTLKCVKVFPGNKNQEIAESLKLDRDYVTQEGGFLSNLDACEP
jgi:hypothetical protein